MVEVLAPQKHETILDPACGTAGFLISAWKHILKSNTSAGSKVAGDQLTPDERGRLARNIKGYDISPDMVRLSLVNLYLHGFADPDVVEYDTLTQDDKWNELADVILANPPFMSPKGGIKPHKRFSVQASRSEVLFVDYMAEHLTATGRAAIVVPEGIIFQSGTAYKALRKMLVDTSLVAVVSLPAGVFNPYSGVKTSILFLDKRVHKQTDKVLFVKVQNDGFNLGAQRRAVANSDLPEATRLLRGWMTAPDNFEGDGVMAQAVERARIGAGGDFSLSADRYVVTIATQSHFPQLPIGDLVATLTPPLKIQTTNYATSGKFPIIDQSQDPIAGWTDDESSLIHPIKPLVIFGDHTCAIKLIGRPFAQGADGIKILQTSDVLQPQFLYFFLKTIPLESDGYKRHFGDLKRKTIPLPPLEVQNQIVAEIEGYQNVIDGARQVLDGYKPRIVAGADWPIFSLGDICTLTSGGTPSKANPDYWIGSIPWVSAKDMKMDRLSDAQLHVSAAAVDESSTRLVQPGSLLILVRGMGLANGVSICEVAIPCAFNQDVKAIEPAVHVDASFLRITLQQQTSQFQKVMETAAHGTLKINTADLLKMQVPLPDLPTQRAIVAEIEAEQALVNANRELIRRMEAKIKVAIDRVWGGGAA